MVTSERDEILRLVSRLAGSRPVRWTDERTTKGDFEGRDWTLEVFDLPLEEHDAIRTKLWKVTRAVRKAMGRTLVFILHTPAETTRLYAWVREAGRSLAMDSALQNVVRFNPAKLVASGGHVRDRVGRTGQYLPEVA